MLWLKVHSHWLLRACLPDSKRKLPPPACQVGLSLCGLPSKGHAVPWHHVHLCQAVELTAFLVHPMLAAVAEDAVAAHSIATDMAWKPV